MAPHKEAMDFLTEIPGIARKGAENYAKEIDAWTTGKEPSEVDTQTLLNDIRDNLVPDSRLLNTVYRVSGSVGNTQGIITRRMRDNLPTQLEFNSLADQYGVAQYNMGVPRLNE